MFLTMYARLVQAPVYAEAVLFSLHAPSALAAMQGAGQQGGHGVCALTAGPGSEFHAAVPRHALTQRPETRAAVLVAGTAVASQKTIPPRRQQYLQS